jgi:hypothetical protein
VCNVLEWITLQKFRNPHSRRMQGFQVQDNGSEQIITIYFRQIKHLKENGTKRRVKHTLMRRGCSHTIMYQKQLYPLLNF